jgi:hypothetical protein
MYRRNASLDQRPIIMIWQTEQSLRNITMAAPDLIECVPISDCLICRTSSPMATTASFMAAITCAEVTWSILLKCQKADMGVLSFTPSYDLMRRTMEAPRSLVGDGVVLLVFFLHLEGDGNAVRKFKVRVIVFNQFPVLEKSEVAEAKDVGPSLLCLGDLEVLTRSHCKENCDGGELSDGSL